MDDEFLSKKIYILILDVVVENQKSVKVFFRLMDLVGRRWWCFAYNRSFFPTRNGWRAWLPKEMQFWWLCYVEGVTKKSRLTNCRFTTISSQISAIYINIFHKTEVQTVIMRCWTVLYINWLKSYDKNEKHAKTQKSPKTVHTNFFFTKSH